MRLEIFTIHNSTINII